jgi:hypothetical protein
VSGWIPSRTIAAAIKLRALKRKINFYRKELGDVTTKLFWAQAEAGEDPLRLLHRARWREFVLRTVRAMSQGATRKDAAMEAGKAVWEKTSHSHSGLQRKVNDMLQKPEVCCAIEWLFEQVGLTPIDAAKIHVQHIRGNPLEKQPPNYQALRDYWTLTFPRQPARLQVQSESWFGKIEEQPMPAIDARDLDEKVIPENPESLPDDPPGVYELPEVTPDETPPQPQETPPQPPQDRGAPLQVQVELESVSAQRAGS